MLKIYNTLTRKKEKFVPLEPNKVGIYMCGVTVYDYCHIGHARTYISTDVIIRYLRWRGYQVNYVRNITDIDDKIIKRANDNNEEFTSVAKKFIQVMHEDFAALNLTLPDHEPRATQYVPQIIAFIEKIIANNHAYVASNGDVYFNVRSFKKYGCLSHHNIEQLESGARVEISEMKKDPLDFALWKLAKPGEPAWESPWGKGRPGWHIECSVMSVTLLGERFDIHGGGRDLIFPHHENELAQAEAVTKKKLASVWIHGGLLQIEKEKMSKSLGNFVTIRDVLKEHDPEVLRYLLISSHYRSPLTFSPELLQQAKHALARFYTALRGLPESKPIQNSKYEIKFIEAMDDDFNTPIALSVLFDLTHEIQRMRDTDLNAAAAHGALLRQLSHPLNILQSDPEIFLKSGADFDVGKIENLIAARQKARKESNWAEADRIRNELSALSITIEDGPNGTTWKSLK